MKSVNKIKIESIKDQLNRATSFGQVDEETQEVCTVLEKQIEDLAVAFVNSFDNNKPRHRYALRLSLIIKHLCLVGFNDAEDINDRYKKQ